MSPTTEASRQKDLRLAFIVLSSYQPVNRSSSVCALVQQKTQSGEFQKKSQHTGFFTRDDNVLWIPSQCKVYLRFINESQAGDLMGDRK